MEFVGGSLCKSFFPSFSYVGIFFTIPKIKNDTHDDSMYTSPGTNVITSSKLILLISSCIDL